MKPVLHQIVLDPDESFTCKAWHLPSRHRRSEMTYLLEYLIVLHIEGRGMRFIGDNAEPFAEYDLVLIGPHLVNSYLSDAQPERSYHISSTFREDLLGEKFLALPEAAAMRQLLALARRGVAFPRSVGERIAPDLIRMSKAKGGERLCLLINILQGMATAPGICQLASDGFSPALEAVEARRLATVCKYVQEFYAGKIQRDTAAKLAGMSPNAFSRFFHKGAGRTFKAYVTEVRVGQACHKLLENDSTIARIAYETGFNNLSNFNHAFRQIKGVTPREFRRINAHTIGFME